MHLTEVDFRDPGPYRLFNTFVTHRITDVTDADELIAFIRSQRAAHPTMRPLVTLDDLDQCSYTSGHASEDERLARDVDYPLDEDPLNLREWEHSGLTHVASQLDRPELRISWEALADTRAGDPVNVAALASRTVTDILDDVLHLMAFPVERDDLVIAGVPNGYFSVDWDTFQNHAVMRRLQERFDYRLFGLGASWLGFERDGTLNADEARALIADLHHLYGDAPEWSLVESAVQAREWLLLGYTDNFAE